MLVSLVIASVLFVVILLSMLYARAFSFGGGGGTAFKGQSGATAKGGQPTIGMAYRTYEGDVAAVDTLTTLNAFGGNTVSTQVPKGAAWLELIDITASTDYGAAVVSVRSLVEIQLMGQGFKNSPHQFNGPGCENQGVTSGVAIGGPHNIRYEGVHIACVEGGDGTIQAVLVGEDPGDVTVSVTLGYVLA